MTAPSTLYPKKTSIGPIAIFTMDWQISVKLLSSILSKPMKPDCEAVSSDPEIIETEIIAMYDAEAGL